MSGSSPLPEQLAGKLRHDFGLDVVIATEMEFYLHGIDAWLTPAEVIATLHESCGKAGLKLFSAGMERGPCQYEVAFMPSHDVTQVIADTDRFKMLMREAFSATSWPELHSNYRAIQKNGFSYSSALPNSENDDTLAIVDFNAKPLPDSPGSGLHVHVHLEDDKGNNVFFREGESFSPILLHSIGGLLELMNPCMVFFSPTEASYARINAPVASPGKVPMERDKGDYNNSPKTVSWGTNNRTVAIRLPTKPMGHKHLEHRVAGSDADTAHVVAAILAGIHYGIAHQCKAGKPIYGDASLPQYGLPKLVHSLGEAVKLRNESTELKAYFPLGT